MIEKIFQDYNRKIIDNSVNNEVNKIIDNEFEQNFTIDNLKQIFNCIDLTSLNTTDTDTSISNMFEKVNSLKNDYPEMPNVAAICVYSNFVAIVKNLLMDKSVKIACVAGNFPSSQTFLEIKIAEAKLAVLDGANEVDIVLNIGNFIEENYIHCFDEIFEIKQGIKGTYLKVILETGMLTYQQIYDASVLSMKAGADFIKTSTGKVEKGATLEAVYIMCLAIKDYYEKEGEMIGIKPAGGISSVEDAIKIFSIVKNVLGEKWLNNKYFRIGTSRLANNILSEIEKKEIKYF